MNDLWQPGFRAASIIDSSGAVWGLRLSAPVELWAPFVNGDFVKLERVGLTGSVIQVKRSEQGDGVKLGFNATYPKTSRIIIGNKRAGFKIKPSVNRHPHFVTYSAEDGLFINLESAGVSGVRLRGRIRGVTRRSQKRHLNGVVPFKLVGSFEGPLIDQAAHFNSLVDQGDISLSVDDVGHLVVKGSVVLTGATHE
jgi:hypothetical protein